jgi:hypothetical protein
MPWSCFCILFLKKGQYSNALSIQGSGEHETIIGVPYALASRNWEGALRILSSGSNEKILIPDIAEKPPHKFTEA